MRILITGVSGGIGTILSNELAKYHEVIGLDIFRNKNINPSIKFFQYDISKDSLPEIKPDIVIHLAAVTDAITCQRNPKIAYSINVNGTKRLLEQLRNKPLVKFIYMSTGYVYPFQDQAIKESSTIKPLNKYAETKYIGELAANEYQKYFPVIILRTFFIYGPNTNKERFIYRIYNNIINNQPVILNKDGKPKVNPIHIIDLINAFNLFISKDAEGAFNIAGEENKTIQEIAELISEIHKKKVEFKFNQKDVKNCIGDINKLRELGFKSKIKLKLGLKGLRNESTMTIKDQQGQHHMSEM